MKKVFSAICIGIAMLSSNDICAKVIEKQISFNKGSTGSQLNDKLTDYDSIQYTLYAKADQLLSFNITSTNNLAKINIYSPGDRPGSAEALYRDSTSGDIILPKTGAYTIQIYQMRNSARRGGTVKYNLNLSVVDYD